MESLEAVGDPRVCEPWWNDECEQISVLLSEAYRDKQANPSKDTVKAFNKVRNKMKQSVADAKQLYEEKLHMPQKHNYNIRYGNPEKIMQHNPEIVSSDKKKRKKKKTMKNDGSESEGDNLDLSQEMHPLAYYITDQEELVSQMFLTIRGTKLEAMLPPVLKSIPLQELKKLCLHELRGMSKKRILCVINGQYMDGSSDSEEEEEGEKDVSIIGNNQNTVTAEKRKETNVDKITENTSNNSQGLPAYLMKTIKVETPDDETPGDKSSAGGKSVMELLELQMRARIIKTMLEKGDDGKVLTEDAIAALMGTGTQAVSLADVVKLEKEPDVCQAKSKSEQDKNDLNKDNGHHERVKKSSDGKRHRDDCGRHSRSSHRKDHHHKSYEGRKGSKRQRSMEVRESDGDYEKKSRRDRSSDKRLQKKKKITRKEFEERMKRAKKNRTYRQRKSSEDEVKANAAKEKETIKEEQVTTEEKVKEDVQNANNKDGVAEPKKEEGEAVSEKEEGEAVSEKEEGEWDSNEEEEGACSPSDISSASYYSSSRSYSSRSRSRSYSRSRSRSPGRRKLRGHSRGRSRSWTRSRSRSMSNERRKRDAGRWAKKRGRDHGASTNKKMSCGIVSLPTSGSQKQQKEEEDNWGQSCDIEFVDSEEDFDDATMDASKNITDSSKKPLPAKGQNSERASISFSLQKKSVPNITPNVDLDDLPLNSPSMKNNRERSAVANVTAIGKNGHAEEPDEIIDLDSPKMISDEILISSDSENELKDPIKTKSVRVEKRELVHSAKELENSVTKDKSANSKTKNISISVTPKTDNGKSNLPLATDLKVLDENALISEKNKESSIEKSSHEVSATKCDAVDEQSKQDEKDPLNENTFSGFVSNSENVVEIQEKDSIDTTEASEIIDVETVDPVEKSIDSVPSNTESIDNGETSISNVDVVMDAEAKTVCQNSSESEVVEIDVTRSDGQSINETQKESQENKIEGEIDPCSGRSDSNLEKLELKEQCAAKSQGTTVESESLKEKVILKAGKNLDQKVRLDHLHESYDEDQEIIPPLGENLQEVTSDPSLELAQDKEEACQETALELTEDCQEIENKSREEEALSIEGSEANTDTKPEEVDTKESECNKSVEPTDDFYRGADQLNFSDDDLENCNKGDTEAVIKNEKEVEPIRINTGLIRKHFTRSKKAEMAAPGKSWTKKEKKKKDKPKDVLQMEGVGLLRTALAESVQSPVSKEDDTEELKLQDLSEGKAASDQGNDEDTCTSWGVSSISSKDEMSVDSRIQSPKETSLPNVGASPKGGNSDNYEPPGDTSQKKSGPVTEIIGVIETSAEPNTDQMEGIDLGGSSWSMRWLQSEKVQKVVSSSKMLSRVRKKIQKKDKATKVVTTTEKPLVAQKKKTLDPVVPIIGSIEEYERLFGMKAKDPDPSDGAAQEQPAQMSSSSVDTSEPVSVLQETKQTPKKHATFGSDDEGEDSEEEALWSKILGN